MLTNEQLSGKANVVVMNSKLNGEQFIETTKGKIVKVHQGDKQGVFATVKIDGEKLERWVFAKYQNNIS